jgi:uncharacterized protein
VGSGESNCLLGTATVLGLKVPGFREKEMSISRQILEALGMRPVHEALDALLARYTLGAIFPYSQNGANSVDSTGDSILHNVIRHNDVTEVMILLESGADVNAIGDMGQLPIDIAAIGGNIGIVRLLFAYGSITDHRSEFGTTALEIAKTQNWTEIEAFLTLFSRSGVVETV